MIKPLKVTDGVTLHSPKHYGDVEVGIDMGADGFKIKYLSFKKLEKWVMAVKRNMAHEK